MSCPQDTNRGWELRNWRSLSQPKRGSLRLFQRRNTVCRQREMGKWAAGSLIRASPTQLAHHPKMFLLPCL
jgi:hypothetical protein